MNNNASIENGSESYGLGNLLGSDVPPLVAEQMRSQLRAFRQRLANDRDRFPRLFGLRWVRSAAVAATACAALAIIAFLLQNGASSVYAQAVEALKQAKTVHAQGTSFRDGKPVKTAEIWYEAGRGVREWGLGANGSALERLDDGQSQWIYNSPGKSVYKTHSQDMIGCIAELIKIDKMMKEMKTRRWAEEDKVINDVQCQAYLSEPSTQDKPSARQVLWVDGDHRAHRIEMRILQEGKWTTDGVVEITYDQPVPADRFIADFGTGVNVVDSTKLASFDTAQSLLKGETLGLALTVHDVSQLDTGCFLLMWSLRPTEDTIARFGPINSWRQGNRVYGRASVDNPRVRSKTQGFVQQMDIASWTQNGIQTKWTLLILKGNWVRPIKSMPIGFSVYSDGELEKDFEKKGEPRYKNEFLLGELPLPQESVAAEQAYRQIYEKAAGLQKVSTPGAVQLTGQTRPLTEEEKQQRIKNGLPAKELETMHATPQYAPSKLTPEQFIQNIQHEYDRLLTIK